MQENARLKCSADESRIRRTAVQEAVVDERVRDVRERE